MTQELESGQAGLRATIQVTRKDTGKVEEYDLIQIPDPQEQQTKEKEQ